MDEIDKFKKKLIRSVVHLRLQCELPYEDVWMRLKQKTGRECEALWKRMCAITAKKLSRLLAADDVRARVSPGARMTTADWLLFDMLLVHEKTDVIGAGTSASEQDAEPQTESPALRRLFQLVANHEIEGCSTFTRTRRWAQLITEYNTEGRECSPLLLQLRWHQLKERARTSFYEFWNLYRGNRTNLPAAVGRTPRPLDVDIARMYSNIVTKPFPEWSELVRSQDVVMPVVFQRFARRARDLPELYSGDLFVTRARPKLTTLPPVDTEPDIVLVEPTIDTIELDDSDVEATKEQPENNDNQQNEASDVSKEPNVTSLRIEGSSEEDGLSNVQIVEASHIPEEIDEEQPSDSIEGDASSPLNADDAQVNNNAEEGMDVTEIVSEPEDSNTWEPNDVESVESPEEPNLEQVLNEKLNAILEEKQASVKSVNISDQPDVEQVLKEKLNAIRQETDSQSMQASEQPDVEQVLKEKLDAIIGETHASILSDQSPEQPEVVEQVLKETLETILEETQGSADDEDSDENDTLFTRNDNEEVHLQDLVSKLKEELSEEKQKGELMAGLSSLVIGELPSSLELIDDGIDFVEDSDDDSMNGGPHINVQKEAQDEVQPKFDLKLMMLPLVYTTKLELMKCLKNGDYKTVNTTGIIDSIVAESKPVSALPVNIKDEVDVEEPPEDITDKNMSDDLIKLSEIDHSEDLVKEGPTAVLDSVGVEDDSDSSEDGIPESERVKLTSGLFRKPRGRTYDPIKLCKNPDFNTRLRRLSAGFLTYEWNRIYLNRLKPLTIDLHKSFEQKLIGKTVYLVRDPNAPKPVSNKLKRSVTSSVLPTAMPAQCLLDNAKNSENSKIVDLELAQRKNKVIELPDIAKVRRMNQHLLTAEVSPIQAAKQVLELPPLTYTSGNRNEAKLSNEANAPSQVIAQSSQDNHPLLEAPKAGEVTKVKVELIDEDDDQEEKHGKTAKFNDLSKPELSRKEAQGYNSATSETVPEKKKYQKRPMVPWYMRPLAHSNAYFEIKDPIDPAKVPWYRTNPYKIETSLLTSDALNKMIGIIAGRDEKVQRKKKKSVAPVKAPVEKTATTTVQEPNDVSVDVSCTIDLSADECMQAIEKIKEEDDLQNIADTIPQKTCKTRVQHHNPTYCCWANRVITITTRRQRGRSKKTWLPKHKCLQECTCCCKDELLKLSDKLELQRLLDPNDPLICCWANKMIKIFKERKKYDSLKCMPLHSCMLGGKTECKCCCKDYLDTVAGAVEKICQSVKNSEERNETANAVYLINKTFSRTPLQRSVPAVTVVNDGIVPYEDVLNTLNLATTADFSSNISEINKQSTEEPKTLSVAIDIDSNNEASVDHITRVPLNTAVTESVAKTQYIIDPKTNLDRSTESTSRPYNTSTESDQFIVLSDDETDTHKESNNGGFYFAPGNAKAAARPPAVSSKTVLQPKPKFIIKCFKNFMKACPVKLGPNKILLTTAKIPADILMPQIKVSAPIPPMPSPFMTNVQLPKGVHFIMEPNGSLSCAIEPGIHLDEKTLFEVKNVLNLVQEQLVNKLPINVATPVDNAVTILSDDENSGNNAAGPSSSENQEEVIDSVALERSTSAPVENCLQSIPQQMDTQDQSEKTANEEDKQVGDENSVNPVRTTEVTENVADVPLPQTVEKISDIADVTQTANEVPKNLADGIIPVQEVSEVEADDTEMKTLEPVTENIGNMTETVDETEENIETKDVTEPEDKENKNEENYCAEEHKESDESPATEQNEQTNENPSIDENSKQPDSEITTEMTEPDNNSPPSDIKETIEADAEEHNQEEIHTQPSVSSKKSILSDLMEMSGISSEDILPPLDDTPPAEVTPLIEVAPPAEAPVYQIIEDPQNPDGPVELTQVTNVAALKFAVAVRAKFFRYTLVTGALAAIEVALQSSRRQPLAPRGPQLPPLVDLTANPTPTPSLQGPNTRGSGGPIIIKKVTGSRPPVLTITPTPPNRRSLLRVPIVTTPIVERRKRGRPRKQVLESTVYNLDATDGEMEEEYLRDSELEDDFGDQRRTITLLKTMLATERAKAAVRLNKDTSSDDDEPLAKKVKRRRREKKMKKKYKLAKKQLKLLQNAAGMYNIKDADSVSQASGLELEGAEPELEDAEPVLEDAEPVPEDPESVLEDSETVPEDIEPVAERIAADLAGEGVCYLNQSSDESENFILGA